MLRSELITWQPVAEQRPDSDITVLVSLNAECLFEPQGPGEPVTLAHFDGEEWIECATGGVITHMVEGWADMPAEMRAAC